MQVVDSPYSNKFGSTKIVQKIGQKKMVNK